MLPKPWETAGLLEPREAFGALQVGYKCNWPAAKKRWLDFPNLLA
jgi:hypothetical protein